MSKITPLVAGNWKMNGLREQAVELGKLAEGLDKAPVDGVDVMICPPTTLVMPFVELMRESKVQIGGQDCHTLVSGANTGDISAEMLADCGVTAIIVGHSERRADHGESDALVKTKAEAAWRAGVTAIICVGETNGQRSFGLALDVVRRQLKNAIPDGATAKNTVVAYEPVWAIGTGLTPTVDDVKKVHDEIRKVLIERFGQENGGGMRLLYGGSVKASNAKELMSVENVDGALVGGASLKADDFLGIINSYKS
jgi:triosephosphate isomerase (TIM)